jgi:RNA polymerase-binding transcription factor
LHFTAAFPEDPGRRTPTLVAKAASARGFLPLTDVWHEFCLGDAPAREPGGRTAMRSIKRDLEEQHNALTDSIKSLGAARDADRGREIVKDPFGAASLTHDEEVAAVVAEHRARQRREVSRALEDINAGRYGICRECEQPIAKSRLKVMPFATRCVACQAQLEGLGRAA